MSKQRKLILIAAAIGIIATFLPWISVSAGAFGYSISRSRNGFHDTGALYFVIMAAIAVVTYMGDKSETLPKNMRLAVIGGGVCAVICLLIAYGNLNDATGEYVVANASIGFGLMLSFAAATAVTIIPLIIKQAGESLQNDLSGLKKGVASFGNNIAATINTAPKEPSKNKMDELEKLIAWRNDGRITQAEYEELKAKIIL